MRNTVKIIIFVIFFFVIGVFFISLTRETNYNTSSLINKEVPQFKIAYFDKNGFYTKQDLIKNNYTLINFRQNFTVKALWVLEYLKTLLKLVIVRN